MNPRRWAFVAYYILTAALIAYAGRGKLPSYFRFAREGVEVQAQVTEAACKGPAPVRYRYAVGSSVFEGAGGAGCGNAPCEAIKTGDPFVAFYLPAHPETNMPGNPGERIVTEGAAVAMAALFFPPLFLFVLFVIARVFGRKITPSCG